MIEQRQLRYKLQCLHRVKHGLKPMMVTVHRKIGTSDFGYRDPLFGPSVLQGHIADEMIALGWCKLVQVDAHTEYLTTTDKGKEIVQDA